MNSREKPRMRSLAFRSPIGRLVVGRFQVVAAAVVSLGLALGASAILMQATGVRVGQALLALWTGSFGSFNGLGTTLVKSTPVIFTGLGCAIGLKAGVFNVGAEGQL